MSRDADVPGYEHPLGHYAGMNPAFIERLRQRRGAQERAARERGLHLTLPAELSAAIRSEARHRGAHPQTLAAALLAELVAQGMVDDVLDGRDVQSVAPGNAIGAGGLTMMQCALVYAIGERTEADGYARVPLETLAEICSRRSANDISVMLHRLRDRGVVETGPRPRPRQPWPRRLTAVGRAVYAALEGRAP